MSKLTQKQELFVQGIMSGLSQRQAYRKAYKAEKMKDETVDSQASKLLKSNKVATRYRELLKQFSNMSLWSREQAFNEYEWLKNKARASIEEEGVRQANSNAFQSALEGMNKIAFYDMEAEDRKLLLELDKREQTQRIKKIELENKIKEDEINGKETDTSLMEALVSVVGGDE